MPMYNDIIKLIGHKKENGDYVEFSIEVFAEKKSVTRQEFYASYQVGINPSCTFEINADDWELTKTIEEDTFRPLYATNVEWEGARYDIIRTYEKNDMVELTCG